MATERTIQELREVLEKIDIDQMDDDDLTGFARVLSEGMEKIREKQRDLAYDVLPWTEWKEPLFSGQDHFDMFIGGTKLQAKDDGRIYYQFEPLSICNGEIHYLANLVNAGWFVKVDPFSYSRPGYRVAVLVRDDRELTARPPLGKELGMNERTFTATITELFPHVSYPGQYAPGSEAWRVIEFVAGEMPWFEIDRCEYVMEGGRGKWGDWKSVTFGRGSPDLDLEIVRYHEKQTP
jgi:hypothetical protein